MWAVDFQFDVTTDGRPVKIVSIVDEHTRENLGGLVERSITGQDLAEELDRIAAERGTYPAVLRSDNGPEMSCVAMADWAVNKVGLCFIPPGEPWRNGYVESFNSRICDECLNINSFWSLAHARGGHRRLETPVQPSPPALLSGIFATLWLRGDLPPPMIGAALGLPSKLAGVAKVGPAAFEALDPAIKLPMPGGSGFSLETVRARNRMGFGVPRSESHPALLVTTRRGWIKAVAVAVLGMLGIGTQTSCAKNPTGGAMPNSTTVYPARRVLTFDPAQPEGTAVAVSGGRITAVGSFEDLRGNGVVDDTFANAVLLPGLIDQHLHPLLGATTLMTEVIAVEDWVLPRKTFQAAHSPEEYRQRLTEAERGLSEPDEWLFSWGYHRLWHGPLDRGALDAISPTRPIVVWQRSGHEFFLNTAAIDTLGLSAEQMAGQGAASEMMDFDAGHWWETGMNLILPALSPLLMSPERITAGLHQMVDYLHANGVTAINEPGIMWAIEPWDLYQQILGAAKTPFLSTFLVDARSQADAGMDPAVAVADAEAQVARASSGKVRLLPRQVKLFADGAIISQLMQMRDPYLDDDGHPDLCHHGEWMMQPDTFRAFATVYWKAGWQLHIHVNGDAGLDLVLDTIEECMAAHPRTDHRTVIVHFANSTEEQIDRIARLGCLVSANSYYPVGFADKYAAHGLGPERADTMVRAASVRSRGISLSLHSDLPMGPAAPLALASFAVNRRTPSGRVAGPEQRISVDDALRAITIDAAYSWRMEDELGSISPGKAANFTVLAEDPYAVDQTHLGDIAIIGTLYDGQWFPAS